MLTIAEISPSACRYSTILDLWAGSTRANKRDFLTAFACSSGLRSSNSRPVKAMPSVLSFSPNTPIRLQMASAVACAGKVFQGLFFFACNDKLVLSKIKSKLSLLTYQWYLFFHTFSSKYIFFHIMTFKVVLLNLNLQCKGFLRKRLVHNPLIQ